MSAVPRAYVRKWKRTVETLASLRPGDESVLCALEGDQLAVLLAAGGSHRPGEVLGSGDSNWIVAQTSAPLSITEPEAGHGRAAGDSPPEGSYCGVPLHWPDKRLYGVLATRSPQSRAYCEPWMELILQMRLLIESDLRTIHYVRQVDARKEQLEDRISERNRELQELNERLADELTKSRQLSEVMRRLTTGGDGAYGRAYFRGLVQQLTELFGGDHAFVSVLMPNRPGHATTLAAYSDGDWIPDFSYELAGAPCAELLTRRDLLIPDGLTERYPKAWLADRLPASSYVGVRLSDTHGVEMGMLVLMGAGELPDSQLAHQFMQLLATRTSTEIQRMRAEQHLRRLSEEDQLTGLLNRASFLARLDGSISRAAGTGQGIAVLFIDLDNFKTVNDSLGHDVGDELLAQVGQRIRCCFAAGDVVARLGGDEFAAVVAADDTDDTVRLDALCADIRRRFSSPFFCHGHELYLSVSIGVSQYPRDGADKQTLLRMADIAMYKAKEGGKNQLQFYSHSLKDSLQHDLRMITRLRRALQQGLFQVFYQPKVDTHTRAIVGVEALLRWRDPEIGPVPPTTFIPLAQRTGNIDALTELLVDTVASDIQAWKAEGLAAPGVAINVSPSQLRDRAFAGRLAGQLRAHGVSPGLLTIELTEDALMLHSGSSGPRILDELADQGFRISIDDFGTGYSSLSYLRSMPIQEVKIDHSFIRGIAEHTDDRAIAAAILSLASTLGLDVVAEGVEEESQLQVLNELGCTTAQGFLFHRPMPEPLLRQLISPVASAV